MPRAGSRSTSGGPPGLAALVAAAVLGLGAFAPAAAQEGDEQEEYELAAVDPYSKGDPAVLAELGYSSLGPFPFGDGFASDDVQSALGGIPMLWVETAHFRLGCSLWPYTVDEDQLERDKLKADLQRLKKVLPSVKSGARELDRWLLLHLWAQRLEELFTRFTELVGLTGADLDELGPFLGQRSRFTVLLLQKESELGRYSSHFLKRDSHTSLRWYLHGAGTLFFGIAFESLTGTYDNDSALHCAVANALGHNFVDGFRGYTFQSPAWWKHGVAHVLSRELDPRYNVYGGGLGAHGEDEDGWNWEPRVRARVRHEYFPSFEEMFVWPDDESLKAPHHMMAWSRARFLLADPAEARCFMLALKAPLPRGVDEAQAMLERQRAALAECSGVGLAELEAAWAKDVERTYSNK